MKKLLRILSTVFMLACNFLAVYLPINGLSTEAISDKLSTLITPAGFTFIIRSVIYIGILLVTYLFLANKLQLSKKTIQRYITGSLANGLWIIAWHYQNLHLSILLIVLLLLSLIMIDRDIRTNVTMHHYNLVRNAFLLYFGWVQIATLLMTTIYMIYQLGWISNTTTWWPILIIILAGFANFLIIWKEKRVITALVGVRALW